ncbi:MAG: sigma 54-interacting transcriptional regulator [Desulfobacteraceae bacterium]|nr:sigma 54-interacting transcriptional regulator [Desulfobacteraceae bacterium]
MVKKPTCEELEQKVQELEKETLRSKELVEVLGKSKEQYHDLYENAPNAYFSVSAEDGSILRCNTAALELLGYDRDALMGMKVFDLYADNPHGISKAQEVFKRSKKGESIRGVEMQMKHKDGYPIWINLLVEPVRYRDGNIIESRSIVIDITEHKRDEKELQKKTHDLGERVKELNCLYKVSQLMGESGRPTDKIIEDCVNLISTSWQYPDITCAKITFEGKEFVTTNWEETIWKQSVDITIGTEKVGNIEVAYLEEKPDIDEGPFSNEERDLIEALERLLKDFTKRKRAEHALVFRSKELQRAQHQLEELFKISRQVSAKNTLPEIIDYIHEIARKIFPESASLIFLLDPGGQNFLNLEDCNPTVMESFLQVQQEIEQAGLIPEFIQYLQKIRSPHVIDSENTSDIPQFFNTITMKYPKWFGLDISIPQQCIGYFVLALSASQEYSREDIHFFLTLFRQIAGHIRHLITHENEINNLRNRVTERTSHGKIIGQGEEMQRIYELIDLVSTSDATVLITGENGTGKELVAQAIHRQSHRKDGAFVVANCSAYSPALLESELFGHEKGAFTGAIKRKLGRIERAQGGILFLDEIGDIAPATQVLLLRFLQDHCFERVGGEETLEVDVRVLAATNRDLGKEVEAGRFRDDLYYRLNVITLQLPPLRDRKEDIPLLCNHFLEKYNLKENKDIKSFSPDAMQVLMDYEWPGNVRQLENSVSHAVILAQSKFIERRHLPKFLKQTVFEPSNTRLAENERRLILNVLQDSNWNKFEAAQRLKISRSTLYSKIRRHRIEKGTD